MLKEVIATGKDIEIAKENARAALGAGPLDDVNFEIVDLGSRGFLGFMAKPAKVKATMEIPDAHEPRPRRERPERKEKENSKNEAKAAAPAATEKSEQKPKNKKKKNGAKKPHDDNAAAKAEKNHSEVIPEPELKMERREVTDGEDMSYDFVKTVIADIGLNASAELYACEDGTRRITIVGEDASTLIGHHGDTLDALQYLANLASARKNINGERDKSRVTLDIEGYRAKREQTLRALARRMAAKALRNKRSVMLEPMTPYERRIIHSEIQKIEGVSTNSIGSESNRKIVIFLTDKKPVGIFDDEETVTPLKAEFAPDADDRTPGNTEPIVTSDEEQDFETVAVAPTAPADDDLADGEDDDIK